jgi:predicted ATPase
LRYFCSPHHQDSALYPSIAQLERAAGFARKHTDEQRLAKLEAVLARGTNDLSQVVPLLAELLSVPTGDRSPPERSYMVRPGLQRLVREGRTVHGRVKLCGAAGRVEVLKEIK